MSDADTVLELQPAKVGLQKQDQSLRARLKMLANHHTQAELARRTGISKGNVSRYLKSGRIPADWLQTVLSEFGVNPSWLMLGKGEMLQSEVSNEAANQSSQLLELALKLNAVDHERLSALQGRRAAQLVRELTDALARHEELRIKLSERVKPVADKLLREYSTLSKAQRHDETVEILAALRQLERLHDDWQFRALLDSVEAIECSFRGDYERSFELARRIVAARLAVGETRGISTARAALNSSQGLIALGRMREAAELSNAVLILAGGETPPTDEFLCLKLPQAFLDLDSGEPTRGLAEMSRLAARLPVSLEHLVKDALLTAGYYIGGTSLKTVIDTCSSNPYYTGSMMLMALWERDLHVLGRLKTVMEKSIQRPDASSAHRKAYLDAVLAGVVPPEQAPRHAVEAFQDAVLRCEAARMAGKSRIAAQAFAAAGKAMAALDPALLPRFLVRAMHMRQAFDLGDKTAASRWVAARLREGYGCLRALATQQGLLEAPNG